jgi:hypothetical protein
MQNLTIDYEAQLPRTRKATYHASQEFMGSAMLDWKILHWRLRAWAYSIQGIATIGRYDDETNPMQRDLLWLGIVVITSIRHIRISSSSSHRVNQPISSTVDHLNANPNAKPVYPLVSTSSAALLSKQSRVLFLSYNSLCPLCCLLVLK